MTMKQITLKTLRLTNWRGEKDRTVAFNPKETTISGGNALGKSRHFDAFMWLLFGKDSLDRKDYNIKTIVDGKAVKRLTCEVVGVLDVAGEEITLRRAYIEDWVKPRGQADEVFKGNHTECWWNDTPVNVSEYQNRVNSIIDDTVFKMITNPLFFAGMDWKKQRDQLFTIAGTISDEAIAESNARFAELLEMIKGKGFADFKKEISAKKKRLMAELKEVQPRIDQTYKMMLPVENFEALEHDLMFLDEKIADIDLSIADTIKAHQSQCQEQEERMKAINILKSEAQQVIFERETKERERVFEANKLRRDKEYQLRDLRQSYDDHSAKSRKLFLDIAGLNEEIQQNEARQDVLRKDWFAENSKEYQGETSCPHCHQLLPAEMINQAVDIFNRNKLSKCGDISQRGKAISENIDALRKEIEAKRCDIDNHKAVIQDLCAKIAVIEDELATTPVVQEAKIIPEEISAYVKLKSRIADMEQDIKQIVLPDTTLLQEQKAELSARRDNLKKRLSAKDIIARCEKEIADLEMHGKELAAQIADIERREYTVGQFTKAKIDECEKRINGLFTMVQFKLFDVTIEGNEYETCVPLVDGVPFQVANTAGQINAGLDIINALCKYYGVTAPIFIDNRESVNDIIATDSQIINLKVTKDKTLKIN